MGGAHAHDRVAVNPLGTKPTPRRIARSRAKLSSGLGVDDFHDVAIWVGEGEQIGTLEVGNVSVGCAHPNEVVLDGRERFGGIDSQCEVIDAEILL